MSHQYDIYEIIKDNINESNADYGAFVDKFKPKLTTDDCYTPKEVYDAVADYVSETFNVSRDNFARPFYPGGDYETYNYPKDCIVVDNPPFSIMAKIVDFYNAKNIRYWLFAPHLTLFNYATRKGICCVVCGFDTVYENGARVNTSFLTNMLAGYKVMTAPKLYDMLYKAQAAKTARKPLYVYPDNIIKVTMCEPLANNGQEFFIADDECIFIRKMENNTKGLFGGGLLVSDKVAERYRRTASAEKKRRMIKDESITIPLSHKEKKWVEWLNKNSDER